MKEQLEKVLYTAKVHTTSGGREGAARSDDGRLELKFAIPGSRNPGTNPEQLFAAGWSSCFISAMWLVSKRMKVTLPPDLSVDTEVDLGPVGDAFGLQARLTVHLPGVEQSVAQTLVESAHQVCPYSRAVYGNIDVVTKVDLARTAA